MWREIITEIRYLAMPPSWEKLTHGVAKHPLAEDDDAGVESHGNEGHQNVGHGQRDYKVVGDDAQFAEARHANDDEEIAENGGGDDEAHQTCLDHQRQRQEPVADDDVGSADPRRHGVLDDIQRVACRVQQGAVVDQRWQFRIDIHRHRGLCNPPPRRIPRRKASIWISRRNK